MEQKYVVCGKKIHFGEPIPEPGLHPGQILDYTIGVVFSGCSNPMCGLRRANIEASMTGNTPKEARKRAEQAIGELVDMACYQLKQKTMFVRTWMNAFNITALAVKLRRDHGRKAVELHKKNGRFISTSEII